MRRVAIPVLVLVVVAAGMFLAGRLLGSDAPELPPALAAVSRIVELDTGNYDGVLLLPNRPAPRGVVVYHHGAGEGAADLYEDPVKRSVIRRILVEGWAVAASDAAGDNWGNRAGLAAYRELWDVVEPQVRTRRVAFLSYSMGGASGLNCIIRGCIPGVRGWIGLFPVVDQRSMTNSAQPDLMLPSIADAFNGGGPPDELVPLEHTDQLLDIPLLMWASPDDTIVPMQSNAEALANLVEAQGGQVELHVVDGEHGDPSHFDPDAVAKFLDRLGGG